MASGQEFTVVKRKHKWKGKKGRCRPSGAQDRFCPDRNTISKKISECRLIIKSTRFFEEVARLQTLHFPLSGDDTVICYGIGRIGNCHVALHQFGLLMEVVALYKPCQVIVYDPVLHEEEKAAITNIGCQIAPRNELCKHRVRGRTLFFMPHCGKAMYNNVLWANWSASHLAKIGIIGNSFISYQDKLPVQQLREEAPYIYRIHNTCLEYPLPNTYPDSTIFNDTSLHLFNSETLSTFPQEFWLSCPEPILDSSDTEIIAGEQ